MTDAFFRAGIGAVVVNAARKILVLRRKGVPEEAWQMPQGGIGINEDPLEALYRELREETGLGDSHVRVVTWTSDWLAYELPLRYRNAKVGWGQVQRWYLCQLVGAENKIRPDRVEFDAIDWVTPNQLIKRVVHFRRGLYTRLMGEFELVGS